VYGFRKSREFLDELTTSFSRLNVNYGVSVNINNWKYYVQKVSSFFRFSLGNIKYRKMNNEV
jgi:hypothetical protein